MNSRQIEEAPFGAVLWDDQVKGLHIRVLRQHRTFYLKYDFQGTQRRRRIGYYPILSVAAARDIAKKKLAVLYAGGDPHEKPPESKKISDLERHFMEVHAPRRKKKTQEMYRGAWKSIREHLGDPPLDRVTRSMIVKLMHDMRETPAQANRTHAVIHKAFNLAENWGWIPERSNPILRIERHKEHKRKRYPSVDEAKALMRALDEFQEEQPIFTAFIWLLCLTGCRSSEILTARREWVKEDGLHLPDSKVGERIIAIPEPAREVIDRIPQIKGNPYLIPGRKEGQHLVGVKGTWKELLKRANVTGLQIRDLRRYFASLGLSGGLTLEAVAQLLGHANPNTTKTYAYLLKDARQKASETAAAQLVGIRDQARIPDK